jgi:hypothetical protein
MSESPYDGFVLETQKPEADINAPGGMHRPLRLIAVARSSSDALQIAKNLGFPKCIVLEWGPSVLKRARELGVNNDDASAIQQ